MALNKNNFKIVRLAGENEYSILRIDTETKKTIATDGHRLATVTFSEEGINIPLGKNYSLPKDTVKRLLKIMSAKSLVTIDDPKTDADEKNIHLKLIDSETIKLEFEKETGSFPDYKRVFPTTTGVKVLLNAKYLSEILNLAKEFGKEVELEVWGPLVAMCIRCKNEKQTFEALLVPLRPKGQ